MKLIRVAREKLVEKDIDWKQVYTDKTLFLKEQFEAVIGPGSYFRFEGDASDGDSYYCIIGPAKVHAPRAKFFAGVRKLPATYSAGGKYFDSLDAAASYAQETWGVSTPRSLRPYTSAQLHGLSDKVKNWKENKDKEEDDNKESSSSDVVKTAADLPRDGAGADYEASRPNRIVPYSPTGVREKQTKEILSWIDQDDQKRITDEYGEELIDSIRDEVARTTGVGSQVGEDSIDDRSTMYHVDKRGNIGLMSLISATDDLYGKNPKIQGATEDGKGGHYLTVAGKLRYIPNGLWDAYNNVVYKIKTGTFEQSNKVEDRGEYRGETSEVLDNPGEPVGFGEGSFGDDYNPFDEMGILSSTGKKKEILSNAIGNLITIAADCDKRGDFVDAEEIHRVIRKHKEEGA